MVELEVLKKPFRQWTAEEVTGVLNGVITQDEEQRMLHNVMEVLQPYMDEYEDEEVVLTDYCFQSRVLFTEEMILDRVVLTEKKKTFYPKRKKNQRLSLSVSCHLL
ncbi:hypothetical protein RB195_000100 [Necator americanus]|uniref:Uncharacterized protein n=1 Tax=Necator americanus TaxID=51031 RepID=A0ABR1D8S7_NECAM